jgi:hypothetical protein
MSMPRAKKMFKRRKVDIEPVISDIKHNMGLKKFLLRGLGKVNIETRLVSIAHNLKDSFKQKLKYCEA